MPDPLAKALHEAMGNIQTFGQNISNAMATALKKAPLPVASQNFPEPEKLDVPTVMEAWRMTYPDYTDLLDPPDGHYPFYEYEEITSIWRLVYLSGKVEQWRVRDDLPPWQLNTTYMEIFATTVMTLASKTDRAEALSDLHVAYAALKQVVLDHGTGVYPGHMAATPAQVAAFRVSSHRFGPPRKVSFSEPVAPFTMLHGDRLAKPGDMLTAMTIRHTTVRVVDTGWKKQEVHETVAVTT